jgi:mitochondrial FAD-linked sulfhydryl oxidase
MEEVIKVAENCTICFDINMFRKHAITKSLSTTDPEPKTSTREKIPCPPDSQELGRSSWTFLHTLAAYYPSNPTAEKQRDTRNFLELFSKLYPCGHCAEHMQAEMEIDPPNVTNREALSLWLCLFHNKVNELVGKPIFDCSRVMERWRTGFGNCIPTDNKKQV